ncbi:MAG: MFS transporter, partial [Gammaproteobacteria bacterium]
MSLASNHPIAGTIYELLTNQEDARACRDIPDTACRVSPTNFVVLLASYFLSKLGDAIANPKTVLTWVMTSVGAPLWMLGFLVPIRESGSLIPQLVIASYVRRMPVRKWVWVAGSALQGLCMLGIGLFTITLTGATAGAAILGLLVAFSLARGLCSVAAKDVLGKTIPKGRRGQLTGWSASAAGLITVGLGSALLVVEPGADANRLYGFALVGAAVLWGLAALTFSFAREFRGATDGGADALREAVQRLSILV